MSRAPSTMRPLLEREWLAWAGGFFEGEGCITFYRPPKPTLVVASTDLDNLERFAAILDCGYTHSRTQRSELSKKPLWVWEIRGFEQCQQILCLLWPYLSLRRQARAKEVLTAIRSEPAAAILRSQAKVELVWEVI